ncbi:MAG: hypothetical protein H7123_09800 [Thermoleophilia bacterium]|nr:hypothetical protein [Thermoleophilia bacterium]
MTDSTTSTSQGDPVAKAIAMLDLLSPEVREQVLSKMAPEMRERVQTRIDSTPEGARPHGGFSDDVAAKRRLMREVAQGLQNQRVKAADETADLLALASSDDRAALAGNQDYDHSEPTPLPAAMGGPVAAAPRAPSARATSNANDPLSQLASVHPAALARAMQGERAEAWAMVLDKLDANVRAALEMYLDGNAREAIETARIAQSGLPPQLAVTIERAIARTVVPRAMREQRMIFSPNPHPQGA